MHFIILICGQPQMTIGQFPGGRITVHLPRMFNQLEYFTDLWRKKYCKTGSFIKIKCVFKENESVWFQKNLFLNQSWKNIESHYESEYVEKISVEWHVLVVCFKRHIDYFPITQQNIMYSSFEKKKQYVFFVILNMSKII